MHNLLYHHSSGVRVRSLIHHMELLGQTRCTSCYTRAYFSPLAVEMIVFSRIYYGLHNSTEGCLFTLQCHCLSDFWPR